MRAWCRVRGAMRLFKVLRMKRVEVLEEIFEPGTRHQGEEEVSQASESDGSVISEVVFRLDRKEAYRVYDRFEENEITVLPEGDFEIRLCCSIDDWVYGLILSFGPSARVMSPEWVRQEVAERIRQMARIYP